MQEQVSIIIPNYNGNRVLHNVLPSIKRQEYNAALFEVVVVDDASRDNSVEIVRREYPGATVVQNVRRRGAAYSKNCGIEVARHEWLLFLDNDIVLADNFISMLMCQAVCAQAPCLQPKILFFHDSSELNSTGGIANIYGYAWDRGIFETDRQQYDHKKNVFFASSAAMLIRKSVILSIGMFDADYGYLNEDFDVGYRLHMAGYETAYVPEAVCFHRLSHTMGRDNPRVKYLMERNRIMTLLKNYEMKTLRSLFPVLLRKKYKKYKNYLVASYRDKVRYFFAALKSWAWIVWHLPMIWVKRRATQRQRRVSDEQIFAIMGEYQQYFPHFSRWAAVRDEPGMAQKVEIS